MPSELAAQHSANRCMPKPARRPVCPGAGALEASPQHPWTETLRCGALTQASESAVLRDLQRSEEAPTEFLRTPALAPAVTSRVDIAALGSVDGMLRACRRDSIFLTVRSPFLVRFCRPAPLRSAQAQAGPAEPPMMTSAPCSSTRKEFWNYFNIGHHYGLPWRLLGGPNKTRRASRVKPPPHQTGLLSRIGGACSVGIDRSYLSSGPFSARAFPNLVDSRCRIPAVELFYAFRV
jgi:hypothetical protein